MSKAKAQLKGPSLAKPILSKDAVLQFAGKRHAEPHYVFRRRYTPRG